LEQVLERERAVGGYGDMMPLAMDFLKAAEGENDPEAAAALARLAVKAAPADPRPHAYLLKLAATRLFEPATALQALWALLRSLAMDPWVHSVGLLRAAVVACTAAWMAALALAAVGVVSFGGPLFHDYSDSFPWRFRRYTPLAFGVFTCCALVAAGVGPAALFLLTALLGFAYLPQRGRVVLGACLALGCLLPSSLGRLSAVAREPGARAWVLYRAWRGDAGADLVAELTRALPPEDLRGQFVRALLARRQGEYARAAGLLQEALKNKTGQTETRTRSNDLPTSSLHLEMGNVSFLQGRLDDALSAYERASLARPDDAIPWLNRHITLLAQLELAEADDALERAKAVDAKTVERYQSGGAGASNRLLPFSPELPPNWIRAELLGEVSNATPWVESFSAGMFTPIRSLHPAYFGVFALLVTFVVGRKAAGRHSRRCPSCGFVVCPRCSRRVKGTRLCPACWAVNRDARSDSAERGRQTERVQKWRATVIRWSGAGRLILPGWVDFLYGDRGPGLFLGLVWAFGAGFVIQSLVYPTNAVPWGAGGGVLLGFTLLILTHLAGALRELGGRRTIRR
jgi:tetratricopeptide (TPR) repeat protein